MTESTFNCLPCNFTTNLRPNFTRHTNTAKHIKICECVQVTTKVDIKAIPEVIPVIPDNDKLDKLMELVLKQNETIEELKQLIKQLIKPIKEPKVKDFNFEQEKLVFKKYKLEKAIKDKKAKKEQEELEAIIKKQNSQKWLECD
jgi:hypothetical protein